MAMLASQARSWAASLSRKWRICAAASVPVIAWLSVARNAPTEPDQKEPTLDHPHVQRVPTMALTAIQAQAKARQAVLF